MRIFGGTPLNGYGEGASQDPSQAAELFQTACDRGNTISCSNLAVLYRRGQGVEQDLQRAAELFRIGCDGGRAVDCENLETLGND